MRENLLITVFPILVIFLIFYLIVLLPQQKQIKKRQQMLSSLKKGDYILTSGGIYGTIVNIKGDIVELKIAENVKINITKDSITAVVNKPPHS